MIIRRVRNGIIGGIVGTAIASFGYLVWYANAGGRLSSQGTKDLISLIGLVGASSTVGSVVGAIAIPRPKALPSQQETVRAWLAERSTVLALPPETLAEIQGVLGDDR